MSEIWKAIPGYEGYYEVSDRGRVRSLDRVVDTARGPWRLKGKVLQSWDNGDGYLRVGLRFDGSRTTPYVHRLVLQAFVGACPVGMEVGHRDGHRPNNALTNLSYVTPSKNCHEIAEHGNRKLTPDQVREIRKRSKLEGDSYRTLAEEFKVCVATVCFVVNRVYYPTVSDHA